jgi:RNA polymerase sigma-70 factor (ECF subfamily)
MQWLHHPGCVKDGWRMAIAGRWRRSWRAPLAAVSGWRNTTPGTPGSPDPVANADTLAAPPAEFEAFFREHERAVYACLWRLTGDAQTARDLTQETFLRAWRHFERIRGYEQPSAWLLRVATNLALSARRHERQRPLSTDLLSDAETPARSDPTQRLAERDMVQRTLLDLPPNQRAALTLREVYGFSCAEIGAVLGLSRDAVKMALFRGREGFRRRYLGKDASDER